MGWPAIKNQRLVRGKRNQEKRHAPGAGGLPLLGSLFKAHRNPLKFALSLRQNYGDIVYFKIGFYTGYLLNHPDYFHHVLNFNNQNYNKENYNYKKLKPILGEGLITANGDRWERDHRLMQPVFHPKKMAGFADTTIKATQAMLVRWDFCAKHGHPVNIGDEMMRLTLSIVTKSLFSTDIPTSMDTVGKAFTILNQDIGYRFKTVFVPPLWIPTRRNHSFKKARKELNRLVYEIIDRRRQKNDNADDLLGALLAARDEFSGGGMTDQQIRDEVMTLMLAGHETTANLLIWTCYLLAKHPFAKHKMVEELEEVLHGMDPGMDDLSSLVYTKKVLQESLRLYPPVWIISRKAIHEDEIGGYSIPAGATVTLCAYILHRHPDFWEKPEEFNPERFSPEQNERRHKYAYVPFGSGPRSCIGKHFAMMEAQLILTMIFQRFNLKLANDQPVEPEPLVTLRPRYPLKMLLDPVTKSATGPG